MELLNLVILSTDIGYLDNGTSDKLRADIEEIARLLSGLRNPPLSTLNSQPSTLNPQLSTLNSQPSTLSHSLFGFEKLVVWQKARELSLALYKVTADFPGEEKFGLVSQIRRAAISIAANIAEGAGRSTGNDKAHFSTQAYGSLMELLNLVILSTDIGYLDNGTSDKLRADIEEIARLLSGLRNAQLKTAKRKP